jgi:hypothetical protein
MSNDSKYGRLYPERAVAPLREAAKALIEMLEGDRSGVGRPSYIAEAKHSLTDLDRLGFPPDEPLFLLRGQDELAAAAVRFYFELYPLHGLPLDREHVKEHVAAMEAWQPRKLPD